MTEDELHVGHRRIVPELQKLLDAATEDPEEFGWLTHDHSDEFQERAREAEEGLGKVAGMPTAENKVDLNSEDQQTLRELALDEPLHYTTRSGAKCTVYLLGTDHDTRETAMDVRAVAEEVKPEYICAEHPPEYKFTEEMGDLWEKFDGDVEKMSKQADRHQMRVVSHLFRNDKYCDQIQEMGTFLSVDVGMCSLMARKLGVPLKWVDISEHTHDKKFGPVWDHVAMHVTMKNVFGIDCVERGLKIEIVYQLIAASDLMPVPVMRLDMSLEHTLAPDIHVLGTHTRDIYMLHRVHQICEANPGKTILAVVGAFHSLNMRTMWKYKMPEALVSSIGSTQNTRKQLHKVFQKYGGRIHSPARDCDYTRFAKRK